MIDCLLIHNDNLPSDLIEAFRDKIKFDIPQSKMLEYSYSFDKEAHRQLEKALEKQNYNVIFLPLYLSEQNYLELTGLRLAAHIRLTPRFNHQHVPIVFLGSESPEQIAKLSYLGNILFTSGVFSTPQQNQNSLKKLLEWIIKNKPKITESELKRCIERLQISPPADYQSHHSLDNELALARWSEYLKCEDNIPEVKKNLQAGLYFKYNRALNHVNQTITGNPYLISKKGKVLLIDDESEKGWTDFHRCFYQHSQQITLDTLIIDYRSLSQQQIIQEADKKIREFDPDILLLDLRLCDEDFDETISPAQLTGIKILKVVKEINKGIQVIITTASNKVWSYQLTNDLGANGYVIKRGYSDVAEDLKNLKRTIETCIERAHYLKPVSLIVKSLTISLDSAIKEKRLDKALGRELIKLFSLSFKMYDKANSKEDFAYGYLALFKNLELIADNYTYVESGNWNAIGSIPLNQYRWDSQIMAYKLINPPAFNNNQPSIFEKLAGLCFQLWSYKGSDVKQLYYSIKRRNEFIHPSENPHSPSLDNECQKIFTSEGYSILLKQLFEISKKIS